MGDPSKSKLVGNKRSRILSNTLERRLANYVAAASTAGVGLLALASPSKAEIVYTPEHVEINYFGIHGIDFDHDGSKEFGLQLFDHVFNNGYAASLGLNVNETGANGLGVIGTGFFPSALAAGLVIGSGDFFQNGRQLLARSRATYSGFSTASGPWLNVGDRYLGVKFQISGQVHYGWIELTNPYPYVGPWLLGYAYNTVPNQAIVAGQTSAGADAVSATPEPATLGPLALGAPGLDFWRRKTNAAEIVKE